MDDRPTALPAPAAALRDRVTAVVVTRDRPEELGRTLLELAALPDPPGVVVVDDASTHDLRGTIRVHPRAELVVRPRREGPVARNHGVRRVGTPYVALTDDDQWWAPGALERAVAMLDADPRLAVVTSRILVGDEERTDPICEEMARSPIAGGSSGVRVPVLSFMAGGAVVRRSAFVEAGGFEPRLMGGGEEETLACDLMTAGWELRYVPDVVSHHHPAGGDKRKDRMLGIRNALWFAWRRRPLRTALRWTAYIVLTTRLSLLTLRGYVAAIAGLPWVLRTRRVVPPHVEARLRALDGAKMRSEARRYG